MTLKTNFILLLILSTTTLIAQPDIYSQLCNLNKEWNAIEPTAELLEIKQFTSEQEIITFHLKQVEKYLTKKNIIHLPDEIQQNREEGLAVLREYWNQKLYPKNNDFNYRIPFFIDDDNTACAVGYIMQGTGYDALAASIAETQNNAYVKEMMGDNILDWATNYGFTVDELAWIQPTYGPCMSSSIYVQNTVKPTCGNNNGAIQINDQDILSYEWEHGANSLQLDNLPAGFYTITGTYEDNNYWGNGESCPFELDIVLENENSADLVFNTISNQSCEQVEDGMKEVIVTNANGSYNIEWSNGETTAIASNLTFGYHFVTVTDEMNCKAIGQTYVSINSPIRSNEVVSGTICNSNTGNTSLNIEGGSGNGIYSVLWMDGNTLENRTNMNAGNYTVLISDDAGCFIEKNITINDDCNGKINCEDDYIDVNNQHHAYMFQFANDVDPFNGTIISVETSQPMHGFVNAYSYLYAGKKLNENNLYIYYEGDETYTGPDSFTAYTIQAQIICKSTWAKRFN